jgi:cytochrome c
LRSFEIVDGFDSTGGGCARAGKLAEGAARMNAPSRMAILSVLLVGCAGAVQAQGNPEEGEQIFKKCRACHDIGGGAKNRVGPVLTNVVGRKAASIAGYAYSTDMKNLGAKGFEWNEDNLRKYLASVKEVVPNGKMVFPGLTDEQDREDLIAYLKKFSQ